MKVYAISGLGADERVFTSLSLDYDLVVLPWKEFSRDETMNSYAYKMISELDLSVPHCFIGVSFGGMLVSELSKLKSATQYVLISSVTEQKELPWWFRLGVPFYKLPLFVFNFTKTWARYFFGVKNRTLAKEILSDTDPHFIKNAIRLIINWKGSGNEGLLKIHGDNDLVIPSRGNESFMVSGGHLAIVDQAEEVSEIINMLIKKAVKENL